MLRDVDRFDEQLFGIGTTCLREQVVPAPTGRWTRPGRTPVAGTGTRGRRRAAGAARNAAHHVDVPRLRLWCISPDPRTAVRARMNNSQAEHKCSAAACSRTLTHCGARRGPSVRSSSTVQRSFFSIVGGERPRLHALHLAALHQERLAGERAVGRREVGDERRRRSPGPTRRSRLRGPSRPRRGRASPR